MSRSPNMATPKRLALAVSIGLDHQVTMRLRSPATATETRPTTPSFTASQRRRVTDWVQPSR